MIKGKNITLRAAEPTDAAIMYVWENDVSVWHVTNTYIPFSRSTLQKYLDSVQDIFTDKQLRLVIEQEGRAVGMIDLFDYEPFHCRAGVGILVANAEERNNGLGTYALETLKTYCKNQLGIRILFCNILENNNSSLRLFEKCGFSRVGCKPRWHKTTDGFLDEVMLQVEL